MNVSRISIMLGLFVLCSCGLKDNVIEAAGTTASEIKLSGVAATGAPIAGGIVQIKDANGQTATPGTTDSSGNYSIDIKSLTPPFIIKVTAKTGRSYLSCASEEDIKAKKKVNISPLTHVIAANTMGEGDPETAFSNFDSTKANAIETKLVAQKEKLRQVLEDANVLSSLSDDGVSTSIDFMNDAFTAGSGQGLDAVLDALKVDITSSQVVIAPKLDPSLKIVDDVTDDSDTLSAPDMSSNISGATDIYDGLKSFMISFADLYNSLPVGSSTQEVNNIKPHFSVNYLDNGAAGRDDGAFAFLCHTENSETVCKDSGKTVSLGNINIIEVSKNDGSAVTALESGVKAKVSIDVYMDGVLDMAGEQMDFIYEDSDGHTSGDTTGLAWRFYGNRRAFDMELGVKSSLHIRRNQSGETTEDKSVSFQTWIDSSSIGSAVSTQGCFYVSGPGIGDGTLSSKFTLNYDSTNNQFKIADRSYRSSDGKYFADQSSADSYCNGTSACDYVYENYNNHEYTLSSSEFNAMGVENKMLVQYSADCSSTITSSYYEYLAKPVKLDDSNKTKYFSSEFFSSSYLSYMCSAMQPSYSFSQPSGIEIDSFGVNGHFDNGNSYRYDSWESMQSELNPTSIQISNYKDQNNSDVSATTVEALGAPNSVHYYTWGRNGYDQAFQGSLECQNWNQNTL